MPHTELMAESRVWFNSRVPQTLYVSQVLMYIQGGLVVAAGALTPRISILTFWGLVYWLMNGPGKIAGAFGIANRRRWGYLLGIAATATPLLARIIEFATTLRLSGLWTAPIGLAYDITLMVALLHPRSIQEVRSWPR